MNLLHYLFWNWIYWAHIISQSAFYLSHLFFFSHLLLQLLNLSTELFHPPSLTGKYTLLLIFFTLCILDMSQSNIKWNFFTLFSDDAKGDSNLQFSPPHSSPVERYSSARRSPFVSARVHPCNGHPRCLGSPPFRRSDTLMLLWGACAEELFPLLV